MATPGRQRYTTGVSSMIRIGAVLPPPTVPPRRETAGRCRPRMRTQPP